MVLDPEAAHSLDPGQERSVHESLKPRDVSAVDGSFENFDQLGVAAGVAGFIDQEILFRDISHVGRRLVFRQ